MDLSDGPTLTVMLDIVTQPPSRDISVLLCIADSNFPSISQSKLAAGLELDVAQSKDNVCPAFAVEGPVMSTLSGATVRFSLRFLCLVCNIAYIEQP